MFTFAKTIVYMFLFNPPALPAQWHKYKRVPDQSLGHVFDTRLVRHVFACVNACSGTYGCVAVNFQSGPGLPVCELNSRSPADPDHTGLELNPAAGVVVYYMDACPEPWIREGGSCYLFSGTQRSWPDSLDYCRTLVSELVAIDDATENVFVRDKAIELDILGTRHLWIGIGYYSTMTSQLVWTSGESLVYSDFEPGQPDNYNGVEDCVVMYTPMNHRWNDVACHMTNAFVCEKPLF